MLSSRFSSREILPRSQKSLSERRDGVGTRRFWGGIGSNPKFWGDLGKNQQKKGKNSQKNKGRPSPNEAPPQRSCRDCREGRDEGKRPQKSTREWENRENPG